MGEKKVIFSINKNNKKGVTMLVEFNSDVSAENSNVTSVSNSAPAPLPVVDPTQGADPLQQQYLEALAALEKALNEDPSDPDDPFAALDIKKAAAELKAAADAIATSGTLDDKATVAALNNDVSQCGPLATLIADAEDPSKTVTDIENDMSHLVDPASWGNASAALNHFQNGLPYKG